jgi:hypothetical protein
MMNVTPKAQYLLFYDMERAGATDHTMTLTRMFESPSAITPVTGEDDTVQDLELILAMDGYTTALQAQTVARALKTTDKPHSSFLSKLVAALLLDGSDADTLALAHAVENADPGSFTTMAKHTLLAAMWNRVCTDAPQKNGLDVFVHMCVRYLIESPDEPNPGEIDIRSPILRNYVPSILASDRVRRAFRASLNSDRTSELRVKATRMLSNPHFPADEGSKLRALLAAIAEK